jgi:hypothetical protein
VSASAKHFVVEAEARLLAEIERRIRVEDPAGRRQQEEQRDRPGQCDPRPQALTIDERPPVTSLFGISAIAKIPSALFQIFSDEKRRLFHNPPTQLRDWPACGFSGRSVASSAGLEERV